MATAPKATSGIAGTNKLGTYEEPIVGKQISKESSLSNWVGPYVTDMLGKGQALANQPYQAYTGPLTAGPSALQSQAFQGISNLVAPSTMGGFTPQSFASPMGGQPTLPSTGVGGEPMVPPAPPPVQPSGIASAYMNPYLREALDPQLRELQRQQEIRRIENAGRLTKAGAFGIGT